MSNSSAPLQRAAEDYARRGWPVFPLAPGKKTPITPHGLKDASTDIQRIRDWWKQHPNANIGIACRPAGLYAIDLDTKDGKDGPAQWARLAEQHGFAVNGTLTNLTPTGGRHLVYAAPDSALPNTSGTLAPGIDTRGPGYIVAPPSVVAGKPYRWEDEAAPILPLPAPVVGLVARLNEPASQPASPTDKPDFISRLQPSRLAALPPVAPDWLVYRFIERGALVMLTAPPGSMKSLAMLDMAVCVAAGKAWLGERKTKACPVLWVNTDNSEATHNARLGAVLRAHHLPEAPLQTSHLFDLDLTNPAHIQALEEAANKIKAGLVILDTLSGALPGVDENATKDMTGPAASLRALAGDGRTVLYLHHPPKSDPAGARGSSVLGGKVDYFFSLTRDANSDLITIKASKARNAPPEEIVAVPHLEFVRLSPDDDDEALNMARFVNGRLAQQANKMAEKQAAIEPAKQKILQALQENSDGLNVNGLERQTGLRHPVIREALDSLLASNDVSERFGPNRQKIYSAF